MSEIFWLTCHVSASIFLGSTRYKIFCVPPTYVPYLPPTYCKKQQPEHHLLPDAIWQMSEHLVPAMLQFLGCIIGSIPKQKMEETPLFLVTVPSSYVVKRNYLFWLRAPTCLPLHEHRTNLPQGYLSRSAKMITKYLPHGGTYQLLMSGQQCDISTDVKIPSLYHTLEHVWSKTTMKAS